MKQTTGKPLANFWLHSNFVLVDGKKISKSLGNIITLEEIEKLGLDLEAFRLWALESHYRSEAHFSWPIMQAAQNRLNSFRAMADLQWQALKTTGHQQPSFFKDKALLESLQDDLNSPLALSIIDNKADILANNLLNSDELADFKDFLLLIDSLFGFTLAKRLDICDKHKTMIKSREDARKANDFNKSDEIRRQLNEEGLLVRDMAHGPIWSSLAS